MREAFDIHQCFLREAEQHGLLRPDVHQHLVVQRLVEAATLGNWTPQERWDAICASLATSKEQLHHLQQLAEIWRKKESSSIPHIDAPGAFATGTAQALAEERRRLWDAARRALGWLHRHRWHSLLVVFLCVYLYGEKRVRELPPPIPTQQHCLPQVVEKPRPDNRYVKRPLPVPEGAAATTMTIQPVSFEQWQTRLESAPDVVLAMLGLAMVGWLLVRIWPHLRRRLEALEAERRALEEKRQAEQAEAKQREAELVAKTQAEYAQLEEEAFAAGLSIRPDYRIELAPPLPATLLDDTATLLGRIYQASRGTKLDVEATLRSTLRTGGRPRPVMQPRRRAVELLVLYDEWDTRPYLPGFHKLLDRWKKLGVLVERWSFEKDPLTLRSPSKQRKIQLEDLLNLHDDAPVILFASRLHIRGQDEYKSWWHWLRQVDLKVWLDPDPRQCSDRDGVEQEAIEKLSAQLPRFALTVAGVQAMVSYLQQQGKGVQIPEWEPLQVSAQIEVAVEKWLACGVQVPDCSYEQFEAVRQVFLREELPDARSIRLLIQRFNNELGPSYRPQEDTVELGQDRKRALKRWLRREHPELAKTWNLLLAEQLVVNDSEDPETAPDLAQIERLKRAVSYRAGAAPDRESALQIVAELDGTPLHAQAQEMKQEVIELFGTEGQSKLSDTPPKFGWKETRGIRLILTSAAWAVATVLVVLSVMRWTMEQRAQWLGEKLAQSVRVTGERIQDYQIEKIESFVQTAYRPMLLPIPIGKFLMGSPKTEKDRRENEVQHEVEITQPFLMMETEVTQGQYESLMGENPSKIRKTVYPTLPTIGGDLCSSGGVGKDLPVYCVDWFDAMAYANRLSEKEGLESCYQTTDKKVQWPKQQGCKGYRLPTEAEWEYAARAGKPFVYAGSDQPEEVAWFSANSKSGVHEAKLPEGQPGYKKPNDWGLHAMSGNVWEWVWDEYAPYKPEDRKNPTGPLLDGSVRVNRGGSWVNGARLVRVANRYGDAPGDRIRSVGFRLARSYP